MAAIAVPGQMGVEDLAPAVPRAEPAAWPPLPESQAKVAASHGVIQEVLVSGVSVSIANTTTNPLGERGGGAGWDEARALVGEAPWLRGEGGSGTEGEGRMQACPCAAQPC